MQPSPLLYDTIIRELRGLFHNVWDSFGMLVLDIEAPHLPTLVERLRREFGFALLLDVTAVDRLPRVPRFDVVYHLLAPAHHKRIRLKLQVGEEEPTVPTLAGLYGAARFLEREVHEMYGVVFAGNDDLRPILLYEGFAGHPLRKDYPMEQEQPLVPYRSQP